MCDGCAHGWQTARNEKMRIRSNVNLGALLEAQGGYHAAFDAAFSVAPCAILQCLHRLPAGRYQNPWQHMCCGDTPSGHTSYAMLYSPNLSLALQVDIHSKLC